MSSIEKQAGSGRAIACAVVAALSLSAAAVLNAQEAAGEAGNAARGKQLYYDHGCYGCHGFNGETGTRDLVATNSPIIADFATFTTFMRLRADQAPLLPSTRMPNYPENVLSDAELRDIFAFIASFELSAPEVEDIPTLRIILDSASR